MISLTNKVFVYGTLRRGFSNHYLIQGARFVGGAQTVENYSLYMDDFPCVVKEEATSPVTGEVFEVTEAMLAVLDALEEHPHLFRREAAPVRLDSGKVVTAWVYFFPRPQGRLVPSGDITSL